MEDTTHLTRLADASTKIVAAIAELASSSLPSDDAALARVCALLDLLQPEGVMHLLGMRRSVRSVTTLPPPRTTLLRSFQQLHKPNGKAKLTVGARAHCKHCHRSQCSWWGSGNGSEPTKNARAVEVAHRILDAAVWLNIHLLPHDVPVMEIRMAEGYGLRWSGDGTFFRGFLEPQMEDGHEKGWRH